MTKISPARSLFLAALGVVFLVAGFYLLTSADSVSAADQQRCEAIIQKIYGDNAEAKASLTPKCSDPGMVAMMDAQANNSGASDTAQAIAKANQSGIMENALSYGFLGFGGVLLFGAIIGFIQGREA